MHAGERGPQYGTRRILLHIKRRRILSRCFWVSKLYAVCMSIATRVCILHTATILQPHSRVEYHSLSIRRRFWWSGVYLRPTVGILEYFLLRLLLIEDAICRLDGNSRDGVVAHAIEILDFEAVPSWWAYLCITLWYHEAFCDQSIVVF